MDTRICGNCGDGFLPASGPQRYCRQEKTRECPICGTGYTVICAKPRSMAKTCSEICQHLLAEQTRQQLRDSGKYAPMARGYSLSSRNFENRICEACGDTYTPTMARQRFCAKKIDLICGFCGIDFQPRKGCESADQQFCSILCGNLSKADSKLSPELIAEYRDIDNWAIDFFESEGRKPNHVDALIYFGTRTPGRANIDLFAVVSRSPFEDIVLAEIEKHLPESIEILRERQPLRNGKTRYELDLWIPELRLAFEIQDFATHSRDADGEPTNGRFILSGNKKGPSYHSLKRSLAKEQIETTLIEIWEDEIYDGSYKRIVAEAIEEARTALRAS